MKTTVLLFTLWMLKARAQCPQSCNCTSTSILCVGQNLETIPDLNSLQFSPLILDFSGNKLLFIDQENFDFPKSEEVKEVYLNNSELADIGEGTFDKLENLQELYLGQNSLNSVPESLIEKLDNMVLLDMSGNYFNDNMPIIRSESLEVLALVNAKISHIPENALKYLPNLKLLVLKQNNIENLSFEVFNYVSSNSFIAKLSLNPWTCTCANLKSFYELSKRKIVETSEPYQCITADNKVVSVFNNNGAIDLMLGQCFTDMDNELLANFGGHKDIRDMVNEDYKYLDSYEYMDEEEEDEREMDIKQMNDEDLEAALPDNCWGLLTNVYNNNNGYFMVTLISTVVSFFIGLLTGMVLSKITNYGCKYGKLEQTSDSQVQLLKA